VEHEFVLHDDGTMAMYLHLSESGVLVDVGDDVTTGDVIGLVGTTGTDVPHLHFEVWEGQGAGTQWYRSLPVSFANATAPLDDWGGLVESYYEALPCGPAG
jgi:murein DD-endopeptidase MepM/ murein hydrolase activator NlpD